MCSALCGAWLRAKGIGLVCRELRRKGDYVLGSVGDF